MSELTLKTSARIYFHINEDYTDSVLIYGQKSGNSSNDTAAKMLFIDVIGINLTAEISGETLPILVEFEHSLKDAEDADHTLINMLKIARSQK